MLSIECCTAPHPLTPTLCSGKMPREARATGAPEGHCFARILLRGDPGRDGRVRIAESTAMLCVKRFADPVISCFSAEFLRQPTADDIKHHTAINERRGFPGMFGSLDCTRWEWKNCAFGEQGQYRGKSGTSTIVLEAVATYDLWVWHAYIGVPGSNNDVNDIELSPFMIDGFVGALQLTGT
ncbi:hypothetical protein PybrP1_013155 [[Pythium] brassicae (nom. inval.)]|nr:hypothetical protein PybrP1_013155 [[Pythium] brassicae (nom. inval.)]